MGTYSFSFETIKPSPHHFERGKMLNWIKGLFKKKPVVVEIHDIVEVEFKYPPKYNVRDKKGRFVKKGKTNGKRR